MTPFLHAVGRFRCHSSAIGCLFLLSVIGGLTACHTHHSKHLQTTQAGHLSTQDSLLGEQFPLPEHLATQKELLYKLSKPAKGVIVPDGESLAGNFGSGSIEVIFDEIDGEPFYFYGHLEAADTETNLEFIVHRDLPNPQLDKLVPGQRYRIHWIETVVSMLPFDEDRYRYFVVYRIDGN